MQYDAVVLAAGFSSRAGADKMSLVIGGKTILARVIEALAPMCGKIVVVGGHHYESVKKITDDYDKVTLVLNSDYHLGMFSSIKCGVLEMENDFFLVPGDLPVFRTSTCRILAEQPGDMVIPVYSERKGHPVLIRKPLISELKAEPVESNLREFRDARDPQYIEVDDGGILLDLDTKDDIKHIRDIIERGNVA